MRQKFLQLEITLYRKVKSEKKAVEGSNPRVQPAWLARIGGLAIQSVCLVVKERGCGSFRFFAELIQVVEDKQDTSQNELLVLAVYFALQS
jgi:hypothetical protein